MAWVLRVRVCTPCLAAPKAGPNGATTFLASWMHMSGDLNKHMCVDADAYIAAMQRCQGNVKPSKAGSRARSSFARTPSRSRAVPSACCEFDEA